MTERPRRLGATAVLLLVAAALGYHLALRARPQPHASSAGAQPAAAEGATAAAAPAAALARPLPAAGPEPEPPQRKVERQLHPRDPREWQGMRVNLDSQAFCADKNGCGLAMACIDGRCGPCATAGDCADGEVCVLDHCVRAELSQCSGLRDCAEGELCILSGYSGGGTRNNEHMRSYCLAGEGGEPQRPGEHASSIGPPEEARTQVGAAAQVDVAALQDEVRARRVEEEAREAAAQNE